VGVRRDEKTTVQINGQSFLRVAGIKILDVVY